MVPCSNKVKEYLFINVKLSELCACQSLVNEALRYLNPVTHSEPCWEVYQLIYALTSTNCLKLWLVTKWMNGHLIRLVI